MKEVKRLGEKLAKYDSAGKEEIEKKLREARANRPGCEACRKDQRIVILPAGDASG